MLSTERGKRVKDELLIDVIKRLLETGKSEDIHIVTCKCSVMTILQGPAKGKVAYCTCGNVLKGAKKE